MTYEAQWLKALEAYNATTQLYPSQPWFSRWVASIVPIYECLLCEDTGVCPECLGEYPEECPAMCGDGSCSCQQGGEKDA